MSKPRIIIDPQPRTVDLIFDAKAQARLASLAELTVFDGGPMPAGLVSGSLALLADAAGRARLAGIRVLSVTGRESESRLAFAGLHQLLRPVLPDHVCEPLNVHALLPTRQFVPAKVRVFLDALDGHAYAEPPALAEL